MKEIRPADAADDAALAALDAATWSPRVTPAPAREPGSAFFGDSHRPEDVLVAERGSRVVGCVIVNHSDAVGRSALRSTGTHSVP